MSDFHLHRGGFLARNVKSLYFAMDRALYAETAAASGGLLQAVDARVKVAGIFALIAAAAFSRRLDALAGILALATALAAASRISIRYLVARAWLGAFLFTGLLAVPALFLTPGPAVLRAPAGWTITAPGLRTAAFLLLRVEASATLALLLVLTTPWMHVLKALRIFRAPVVFVVILGMTCRYVLLLLETAHEMFEARQSRAVGSLAGAARRRMTVSAAGTLLSRTYQLSGDVYLAMQSRGFRGEVYLLDDFRMTPRDWMALAAFAALAAAAAWMGAR